MMNRLQVQFDLSPDEAGGHPLDDLTAALARVVTESEDDFMALGMSLQQVQQESTAQRRRIADTMALFESGGETGILQQISAYVRNSQQGTLEAQQTADNLCSDLSHMMQLMDAIARQTHSLERGGLLLNVIGINTGIECARYAEMESMFKVVSHDTISLAEQIRSSTTRLLEQTFGAKNAQGKTLAEARKSIETLKGLARESNNATESALNKVAELVDYSISMVNEADHMAGSISTEINRVVMGIQFHDNLRQRVEHVNEALLETAVPYELLSEEERCNTFLALELQLAQLETLNGELDSLYQTQSQALENIVSEVTRLERRLEEMACDQRVDSDVENPVEVLLEGVTSLDRLNQDSLELGLKIGASAGRAEQIVRDMQEAIRSTFAIASSVKINALNAIIKAAKFGHNGEALQVLAQGMVTVARDARRQVGDFNDLLDQLGELAHKEAAAKAEAERLSVREDFDQQKIGQVFEVFREQLVHSGKDCTSLEQGLAAEQQRLRFICNLRDTLTELGSNLREYAEQVKPSDLELLQRLRENFGERLEERYTMNEERDIHQQVLQLAAVQTTETQGVGAGECLFFETDEIASNDSGEDSAAAHEVAEGTSAISEDRAVTPAVADGEADDFDSDGVLFDTAPQSPTVTGQIEGAIAPEIELWDEVAQEAAEAAAAIATPAEERSEQGPPPAADEDAAKEDFGDNVELF